MVENVMTFIPSVGPLVFAFASTSWYARICDAWNQRRHVLRLPPIATGRFSSRAGGRAGGAQARRERIDRVRSD